MCSEILYIYLTIKKSHVHFTLALALPNAHFRHLAAKRSEQVVSDEFDRAGLQFTNINTLEFPDNES